MIETRILPPEEWHRLDGTEAASVWRFLNPENTRVLVVEDEGRIVGCWLMLRTVHAECLWAAPEYRGSFGVAKRLLNGMREQALAWGVEKVITGSVSAHVTDLIRRFGGTPMPCESFVLPVDMKRARRAAADRALGRSFHQQLGALVPEEQHPESADHDEMVGRTIRVAVDEHEPERAMREYNQWAFRAGYVPIHYMGTVNGQVLADIVTARIAVGSDYTVQVMEEEPCQQRQ